MDKLSNFQHSAAVNELVGNQAGAGWEAGRHQKGIIASEINEIWEGLVLQDIELTRDGIVDGLFTLYGLAYRLGFNPDEDYADMMESQWSKFDPTYEDAEKTRQKYEDQGVEVTQREAHHPYTGELLIVTLSAKDQKDLAGKMINRGKWLKSHRFEEPVFRPLDEGVEKTLPQLPPETLQRLKEYIAIYGELRYDSRGEKVLATLSIDENTSLELRSVNRLEKMDSLHIYGFTMPGVDADPMWYQLQEPGPFDVGSVGLKPIKKDDPYHNQLIQNFFAENLDYGRICFGCIMVIKDTDHSVD